MKRRIAALGLALGCSMAMAAEFPTQPLTVIVPYAAGGSADALTRALGQALGKTAGVQVVVDNRPGGGTVIGTQALLGRPADGHSVMVNAASLVINPYVMSKLSYDTQTAFTPVTKLASNPHVLVVSAKVPAANLQEFLAWAKSQGDKATFSSFGNGSSGHLGFERFAKEAGLSMLHVPYKGAAPSTTAVLSGEVDATFGDVGVVAPHIRAGGMKALGVAGTERSDALPDVPTFAEAGLPGFTSYTWFGLITRSEVPADRVARLNQLFTEALAEPNVQALLAQQGMRAEPSSPAAFTTFLANESQAYGKVIQQIGLTLD